MLIRFWGVRGSLPSPLAPSAVKEKIAGILENARPEDFADAESRKRFLNGLPPWLYGTTGGNTPCLSITFEDFADTVIFDCGSGMRELGAACASGKLASAGCHVFLSHFHSDHINGLPFFSPLYDKDVRMDFYSPVNGMEEILSRQMHGPYFPVTLESSASRKNYHLLDGPCTVGTAGLSFRQMNHPGDCFSYLLTHNGKKCIYATDTELSGSDFSRTEENTAFFQNADIIILDSQYTLGEAIDKNHWGHSAFSLSVDFAANWEIKHLVLFHHDPFYSDRKLHGMLQSARWYARQLGIDGMEISLAEEGLEIQV